MDYTIMPADYIGSCAVGQLPLGDGFGAGYVLAMPPSSPKRTEVGDRIWRAMKARGDSLATVARAFKAKDLPIRSVGGLRYMMEEAERYDERVITALTERYGHSRSYWLTGVEDIAPSVRSVDRLGAYITGTFMEEVRQTVNAEVRRRVDELLDSAEQRLLVSLPVFLGEGPIEPRQLVQHVLEVLRDSAPQQPGENPSSRGSSTKKSA